jgi:diketogulonate reductase-like aldo/keto reductase
VELCLDICLKEMGLEYVDLYLAHWPFAEVPVSRAALEKSKGGADDALYGILEKDDKPVIDWEHTSAPLAKIAGTCDRTDFL